MNDDRWRTTKWKRRCADKTSSAGCRESLCKGGILHPRMKAGALKYDGLCMSLCGRNPHAPQLSMSKMKAGALTLNGRCRSHCGKNPHVPQTSLGRRVRWEYPHSPRNIKTLMMLRVSQPSRGDILHHSRKSSLRFLAECHCWNH